jgi:hypothetical protein
MFRINVLMLVVFYVTASDSGDGAMLSASASSSPSASYSIQAISEFSSMIADLTSPGDLIQETNFSEVRRLLSRPDLLRNILFSGSLSERQLEVVAYLCQGYDFAIADEFLGVWADAFKRGIVTPRVMLTVVCPGFEWNYKWAVNSNGSKHVERIMNHVLYLEAQHSEQTQGDLRNFLLLCLNGTVRRSAIEAQKSGIINQLDIP